MHRAESAGEFQTINFRHHKISDQEMNRRGLARQSQGFRSALGFQHRVTLQAQNLRLHLANHRVVIHDQQRLGRLGYSRRNWKGRRQPANESALPGAEQIGNAFMSVLRDHKELSPVKLNQVCVDGQPHKSFRPAPAPSRDKRQQ